MADRSVDPIGNCIANRDLWNTDFHPRYGRRITEGIMERFDVITLRNMQIL